MTWDRMIAHSLAGHERQPYIKNSSGAKFTFDPNGAAMLANERIAHRQTQAVSRYTRSFGIFGGKEGQEDFSHIFWRYATTAVRHRQHHARTIRNR